MNANNDGNLLGRITALALILGAVYGVHAISRGRLGCPLGNGSCCGMESSAHSIDAHHESEHPMDVDGGEDEAKLEEKAPVAPPKPAE